MSKSINLALPIKVSMGVDVAANPDPLDIRISMDIHVFTHYAHYVHEHNIFEHNTNILEAFRQYLNSIFSNNYVGNEYEEEEGRRDESKPTPTSASTSQRRAGLPERRKGGPPAKHSLTACEGVRESQEEAMKEVVIGGYVLDSLILASR
jgi:hypothetical protein